NNEQVDIPDLNIYAELRGPSIITPSIIYRNGPNAGYDVTFTPHVAGKYNVLIRLDHTRGVGDVSCTMDTTHLLLENVTLSEEYRTVIVAPSNIS
ncbi:hypothetical protein SARC_14100, partial [Sphaeroforma arctica JP610]